VETKKYPTIAQFFEETSDSYRFYIYDNLFFLPWGSNAFQLVQHSQLVGRRR
jgi:hypothetical protein